MDRTDRCPTCGSWPNPFTGAAARRAAEGGRLESWVLGWLTGAGRNVPMARALRERRQWWIGPLAAPAALLRRIVGPEPGMPYPRDECDWVPRLDGIAESIRAGWDAPPVIAGYEAGALVVNDGNHRYAAQVRMGRTSVAAILRFDDERAWRDFRPPWAHGALREPGATPQRQ